MEFGDWIRERRNALGLDMRGFAEQAGLDIGTISRVENGVSEPTLITAVRLSEGVGAQASDVLNALREKGPRVSSSSEQHPIEGMPYLTLDDVVQFVAQRRKPMQKVDDYLVSLMDLALRSQRELISREKMSRLPNSWPHFNSSSIDLMLTSSLQSFYSFQINYPSNFATDEIFKIYTHGGVLNFEDAGQYIRADRRKRKQTLTRYEHSLKLSDSLLARIERGILDGIKLKDVLLLNETLGTNDDVLGIYWNAARLHSKVRSNRETEVDVGNALTKDGVLPEQKPRSLGEIWFNRQEFEIVTILIRVGRWLQQMKLDTTTESWLDDLRDVITRSY